MTETEYLRHDAVALAAAVRRGEVEPRELLALAQARLNRLQPRLNLLARSLEPQARAQLAAGWPAGAPLGGVPGLVKDAVHDVAGVPMAYGSRALQRHVPDVDSAIVRRLRGAGLLLLGHTRSPEFALKAATDPAFGGRTANPWDLGRVPGGSSGGSAAAVAAGIVPVAAGNDGGGSIRIPAACCGLVGLRPSRGRVSVGPGLGEVWNGASSDGVLSRSVRDTAVALDVLAGPEPGDPFVIAAPPAPFAELARRPCPRLRIGFTSASPLGTPVDGEAVAAVRGTALLLEGLGHTVEEAAPAVDGVALAQDFLHLYFGQVGALAARARALGARGNDLEPLTRVLEVLGHATSATACQQHLARWNQHARALAAFHARFDLLLTPTLAGPPVRHGTGDPPAWQQSLLAALAGSGVLGLLARSGLLQGTVDRIAIDNLQHVPFTQLANLTGTPAISLPLHWTAEGLPLGVHFVARFGEEGLLLQLATELEQARPWFDRLPPLAREG